MRIAIMSALLAVGISAQTISVAQLPFPPSAENDRPEQSLAQLWGAAALHPKSATARLNVGAALLSLNRLQQAEWAAREALDLDPDNSRAQLLLGWTMTRQYHYTAEALDYLHRAVEAYPEAHLGAADVLAHQGSILEARAEVEAYLASGAAGYRKIAGTWLKLLN